MLSNRFLGGILALGLMGGQLVGVQDVRVTNGGNPDGVGNVITTPMPTATTTYSLPAPCSIVSTASNNSTSCKTTAGNLYTVWAVNPTGTIGFIRLYDSTSAPTCSSSTGFVPPAIPVPADTSGRGIVIPRTVPEGFANGIGVCFTGGGSSTDNTNGPAGVYIGLDRK